MIDIQIGKVGRILEGPDIGKYVKVIDDAVNTGGFLVLICANPDLSVGFDDWVENESGLQGYFEETGWRIEWISEGTDVA
ncbi:MAG: hypothetical protein HY255_07630 [Betaproteobacteria bacterium]|nr:hypothetical protein [Betaproteobacteria bacterium]